MATPTSQHPPERFNFAAHLFALNAGHSGRVAYRDDRESLSYGVLEMRARTFAATLRERGVRREERVLLLMLDTVDWPVAFLGCLYAGIVPVAANTLLKPSDYSYVIEHSRAQAAIVSGALEGALKEAMADTVHEVAFTIVSRPGMSGGIDFREALARHAPLAAHAETAADDFAFWLYSSGSTGRPKGAVHTHANLWWTAELYAKPILGLTGADVVFSAAKLFFAYGLGNALTFPLTAGASVVLMPERPTPQSVFARLVEHKPSIFCGVPTLYAAMMASADLPARADVAMRRCVSAGEALPRDLGERFTAHFGAEILDGIGSTEMLHIFLSNRPGAVRYGTTGQAVPGYDVELRGEDGGAVAAGEIGDLYVRGPSAAAMYWTQRDRSRATFQGAWTHSGDKYVLSADGYYTYAGRADDMLKVSGQYVSPFEVETTLMEHAAVLEAAVIGTPDADGLTKTKAFVVLHQGISASRELASDLQAFIKERLAPHKYPRSIEFVDELPKTATGKIQRFRLREREKL